MAAAAAGEGRGFTIKHMFHQGTRRRVLLAAVLAVVIAATSLQVAALADVIRRGPALFVAAAVPVWIVVNGS